MGTASWLVSLILNIKDKRQQQDNESHDSFVWHRDDRETFEGSAPTPTLFLTFSPKGILGLCHLHPCLHPEERKLVQQHWEWASCPQGERYLLLGPSGACHQMNCLQTLGVSGGHRLYLDPMRKKECGKDDHSYGMGPGEGQHDGAVWTSWSATSGHLPGHISQERVW